MGQTLLQKGTKVHTDSFQVWKKRLSLRNELVMSENKVFRTSAYCYHGSSSRLLLLRACWVYNPRVVIGIEDKFKDYLRQLDPAQHQNLLPWGRYDASQSDFVVAARQYMESTLEGRLKAEPPLRAQEKTFICTQLLIGLLAIHDKGKFHNAIKASNCLLTSDCRLLISDFAFYKPLHISESDLASLRTFYGSSMESCSLAPEKITREGHSEEPTPQKGQAMDIFGAGCVAFQLFNGRPAFTYQSLCNYRKEGQTPILECPAFLEYPIFKQAMSRDAGQRPSAKKMLLGWLRDCKEGEQQLFVWYICGALRVLDAAATDSKLAFLAMLIRELENLNVPFVFTNSLPVSMSEADFLSLFFRRIDKDIRPAILSDPLLQPFTATLAQIIDRHFKAAGQHKHQNHFKQYTQSLEEVLDKQAKQTQSRVPARQHVAICIQTAPKEGHAKAILSGKPDFYSYKQHMTAVAWLNCEFKVAESQPHPFWQSCRALDYLVSLVNSLIPHCRLLNCMLVGVELLGLLGRHCSDFAKVELVFPVLSSFFEHPEQRLVANALGEAVAVLASVKVPFRHGAGAIRYYQLVQRAFTKLCRVVEQDSLVVVIGHVPAIIEILTRLFLNVLPFELVPPSQEFTEMLLERMYSAPAEASYRFLEVLAEINPVLLDGSSIEQVIKYLLNTHQLACCKFGERLPMPFNQAFPFIQQCYKKGRLFLYQLLRWAGLPNATTMPATMLRLSCVSTLSPNQWIRKTALVCFKRGLQTLPLETIFQTLAEVADFPFPMFPNQIDLLPPPLTYQQLEQAPVSRLHKYFLELRGKDNVRTEQVQALDCPQFEIDLSRRASLLVFMLCSEGLMGLMGLNVANIDSQKSVAFEINRQLKYKIDLETGLTHELRMFLRDYFGLCRSNFNSYLLEMRFRERHQRSQFIDSLLECALLLQSFESVGVPAFDSLGQVDRIVSAGPKRTECVQLAKIYEHQDIIVKLEPFPGGRFVSGSMDGTIRLFHIRSFEESVLADSARIINSKSEIIDLKVLEGTSSVAICSKNNLKIYNLEREKEDPVYTHSNSQDLCLLSTNNSRTGISLLALDCNSVLSVFDLRVSRPVMQCDLGFRGTPTSLLSLGDSEHIQSTMAGILVIYDIRANQASAALQYMNGNDQPQPITRLFPMDGQVAVTFPSDLFEFELYGSDYLAGGEEQVKAQTHYLSYRKDVICQDNYFVGADPHRYVGWKTFALAPREALPSLHQRSKIDQLQAFLRDPLRRKCHQVRKEIMQENEGLLNRLSSIRASRHLPFVLPFGEHILTHQNPDGQGFDLNFTLLPRNEMVRRKEVGEYAETMFVDGKYVAFKQSVSKYSYSAGCVVDSHVVVAGRDRDHFIRIFR